MCGYLEDYISVTAKVQKSQSKDYEKILKVSNSVSMDRVPVLIQTIAYRL